MGIGPTVIDDTTRAAYQLREPLSMPDRPQPRRSLADAGRTEPSDAELSDAELSDASGPAPTTEWAASADREVAIEKFATTKPQEAPAPTAQTNPWLPPNRTTTTPTGTNPTPHHHRPPPQASPRMSTSRRWVRPAGIVMVVVLAVIGLLRLTSSAAPPKSVLIRDTSGALSFSAPDQWRHVESDGFAATSSIEPPATFVLATADDANGFLLPSSELDESLETVLVSLEPIPEAATLTRDVAVVATRRMATRIAYGFPNTTVDQIVATNVPGTFAATQLDATTGRHQALRVVAAVGSKGLVVAIARGRTGSGEYEDAIATLSTLQVAVGTPVQPDATASAALAVRFAESDRQDQEARDRLVTLTRALAPQPRVDPQSLATQLGIATTIDPPPANPPAPFVSIVSNAGTTTLATQGAGTCFAAELRPGVTRFGYQLSTVCNAADHLEMRGLAQTRSDAFPPGPSRT